MTEVAFSSRDLAQYWMILGYELLMLTFKCARDRQMLIIMFCGCLYAEDLRLLSFGAKI